MPKKATKKVAANGHDTKPKRKREPWSAERKANFKAAIAARNAEKLKKAAAKKTAKTSAATTATGTTAKKRGRPPKSQVARVEAVTNGTTQAAELQPTNGSKVPAQAREVISALDVLVHKGIIDGGQAWSHARKALLG